MKKLGALVCLRGRMCGVKITIEETNEGARTVFSFSGTHPNGKDFCGTADDLVTALDMAKECVEMEWESK